jgi:dihydroorotase-like cyclic amidohydrolase
MVMEGACGFSDDGHGVQSAGMMRTCMEYVSQFDRAVIAHCNHRERAELVKEELLRKIPFRDVIITETAGVATVYAGDGGVVLAC